MAHYLIEIDETFDVPRRKAFAVFADHNRFGKLVGAPVKRIKDSDQADPNGIGSVRKIGIGPLSIEEKVLGFEPDSLIEYTITSASPLRNHLGRILFSDAGEGRTRIQYTISFEDIVPFTGKVVGSALEQGLRRGIRKLPALA
ncbi:SRPBCC family protein [Marinobacter daepoensis]|uniref:SRPBCC family protein n=1 Tax=Marinobacter daepoensis TaxID=262077 RepID=A0ABS3BIL9_9GAMM|nr:SRPBCC family protein [Marinobacter daepoensis]MBN7771322.1 SRPBCC family protein [Marinobacter daepoensis]MBY6034407.1 SRPBCC family protein [Marinobacter daepoensis]MBY6079923.1 SRPBCC family protein [Marinobacter daepoensis]